MNRPSDTDPRTEECLRKAAGGATADAVESGAEIARKSDVDARTGQRWCSADRSNPTAYLDGWLWRVSDPERLLAHWQSVVYQRRVASKTTRWLVEQWWDLTEHECDHDAAEDWTTLNGTDGYEEALVDEREGKIHLQRAAYRRELAKRGVDPRDYKGAG